MTATPVIAHRSTGTALTRSAVGLALGLCLLVGCTGGGESEFTINEEVSELYAPAQQLVRQELTDKFGTPQAIKLWTDLPIDFGGLGGTVRELTDDEKSIFDLQIAVPIAWDESQDEVTVNPGDELLFLDGPYRGYSLPIAEYDAADGTLLLEKHQFKAGEEPPAAGTRILFKPGAQIKEGRALYHEHCLHCHGATGDGNGPTAKYLNPRPRDYRQGTFKFKSTDGTDRVRREDLARVLRHGIPGTYMPSFMLLTEAELDAIIEYVRWLSFRGQYERIMVASIDAEGFSQTAVEERLQEESAKEVRAAWNEVAAEDLPEVFADDMESRMEDWEKVDDPESQLKPLTPRDGLNKPLMAFFGQLAGAPSAKITSVENPPTKEELEADADLNDYGVIDTEPVDGLDLIKEMSVMWTSGEGAGQFWTLPASVRRRKQLRPTIDEMPPYAIKEGDTFVVLDAEPPALQLDYLAKSGTSFEQLAELAQNPEEFETELLKLSEARGRKIYLDAKTANCISCHGPKGLGNGPLTEDYWALPDDDTKTYDVPGMHDDWGHPIAPRNLTKGIYRGGRRPIDVYRRVYAGIRGTPMPPRAGVLVDTQNGTDYMVWDVVNYVLSIPHRAQEPDYFSKQEVIAAAELPKSDNPANVPDMEPAFDPAPVDGSDGDSDSNTVPEPLPAPKPESADAAE